MWIRIYPGEGCTLSPRPVTELGFLSYKRIDVRAPDRGALRLLTYIEYAWTIIGRHLRLTYLSWASALMHVRLVPFQRRLGIRKIHYDISGKYS